MVCLIFLGIFFFFTFMGGKMSGSDDAMVHYLISVITGKQGAAQDKL